MDLRRSRHSHGELCGRGRESNEGRVVGWGDAGIGGGGTVVVDSRFGGDRPATAHIRTRSTILHLKTYHLHPSDHDYQYFLS